MGHIVIAPVGDNPQALFVGIKEFPTEKVILVTPRENLREAEKLKKKLEEFTIGGEIAELSENLMESMFREFGRIVSAYPPDNLIVNVATGDRMSTCAALSAAFANGLKAFGVSEGRAMLMPIMRLSYYHELSEKKLKIMQALRGQDFISPIDLAKKLKMSISLVSYHINGNFHSKGLKGYHLVEVQEKGKNVFIRLSQIGNMLLRGYIK